MPRYVAFLRAINVGGHTVKMDRLRGLFEEIGLEGVSTFIASGNVIFDSAGPPGDLERHISEHLHRALGYEVVPFVRTFEELSPIVSHPPFAEGEIADADTLYVCFLPEPVDAGVAAEVAALSTPTQTLRLHGRELYWLCRTRISESDVSASAVGRVLGVPTTMRNLNTLRRILAKFS